MSRPLVLRSSGLFGQLTNGELINSGGTSHSTWSIGGKGAILEDGTNSRGTGPNLSLQLAYDTSETVDGAATIVLSSGKDFVIADDEDPILTIDGDERKVTITGDLEVLGANITISTLIIDSDHWVISPLSGATIAFHINPDFVNGQAATDLIRVRNYHNGPPVFTIDKDGNVTTTQKITSGSDVTVGGNLRVDTSLSGAGRLIVGKALVGRFDSNDIYFIGSATETIFYGGQLSGTDTSLRLRYSQGAAEQGEILINKHGAWAFDGSEYGSSGQVLTSKGDGTPPTWENPSAGIGTGNVHGFWFEQNTPSDTWIIDHAGTMETRRRSITVYDLSYEQVIPQTVQSNSSQVVTVSFAEPMAGYALVLLYAETTTP